ncbi:MAG: hypothetical protein H6707_20490 [Deltaproteobacteria bacterium]|nr:hypothetical protein [Deltaproteobacteria bacterium]
MDYQVVRRVLDSLPALAWHCVLSPSGHIEVSAGNRVVFFDQGFFEGAWTGEYADFGFDRALGFFGSGLRLTDEGPLIVTPSFPHYSLYSHHDGERLHFSNSFSFLLAATGRDLDSQYGGYNFDLVKRVRLSQYPEETQLDQGMVGLHYVENILVRSDLSIERRGRPIPQNPFDDYASYVAFMLEHTQQLLDNARAKERPFRYTNSVCTISRGYDSAACASLVSRLGCEESLTFSSGGSLLKTGDTAKVSYVSDSGAEIAAILGLKVTELPRDAYRSKIEPLGEAEFLANRDTNEIGWVGFTDRIRDSVFFQGSWGDGMWERVRPKARLWGPPPASTDDFRLRVNAIFVHLPTINYPYLARVRRLSCSDEMRPWSVGGKYDRPIPRRLLEERGVPREAFGRQKTAIAAMFCIYGSNTLSEESRQSMKAFCDERGFDASALAIAQPMTLADNQSVVVNASQMTGFGAKRDAETPFVEFRWGVHVMRQRYQDALRAG